MKRLFFQQDIRPGDSGNPGRWSNTKPVDRFEAVTEDRANLVSSHVSSTNGLEMHAPALDIDLPCTLLESSPGKHHLYIEKSMSWEHYRMLLCVLAEVGIIERGYANACIAKGATFLRKPGTYKDVTVPREREGVYNPETSVVIPREQYEAMQALFTNNTPQQPSETYLA